MRMFALALAACGTAHHVAPPDVAITPDAAPDAAAAVSWGERCGNGVDDDGDGLVDEDCAPSLFTGVFAPEVAADPLLGQVHVSVVQTYRATKQPDAGLVEQDLGAIFAAGYVAHLNLEPAGYSDYSPEALHGDLATVAQEIANALAAHPGSRVIVTFGAEMNGNWTDWGCLPAAQYIAVYRAAHDAVDQALGTIDRRRVRWAYGPNSTSSANCGSIAGYYPGHAYVDLLGLSAYRSGSASVDDAVFSPVDSMFAALGYPDAWQEDRFVLLQTGSRAATDRDQWVAQLVTQATADRRIAGIIYFDEGDWSLPAAELGEAIATAPVADGRLDAIFAPQFWDVPYSHPAFPEIQGLADANVTTGCADSPPRFCPDVEITAADAAALVTRAVPGSHVELDDPVTETALASALVQLGMSPQPANPVTATRARAAVLIARAAQLAPQSNR
jgi:hypothetical protein